MIQPSLPQRARVVVIGGGVIGTSVAYHLAHLGWTRRRPARARPAHLGHDVARGGADGDLRVDVGDLDPSCGSTPATCTRGSRTRPAWPPGSSRSGFIEVAADEGRLEEYRRVSAFNRLTGCRRPRDLPARGGASCSRWPAPTTCSPASTSPRTAGSTPSTSRCRWRRAPGMQGATHPRGRPGHRGAALARGAVTGRAHRPTATSRRSTSSTAPACGPASSAQRPA